MKPKLSDLWRWDGKISRGPFLLWGALLFTIKYTLDHLLLELVFGRSWSVFYYFDQPVPWIKGLSPSRNTEEFAMLLTAAIPFLWVGVMLCFKRLRSAGMPLWLALLFVVPILKWFLFVALALVPERPEGNVVSPVQDHRWPVIGCLPKSVLGSATLAVGKLPIEARLNRGRFQSWRPQIVSCRAAD